MTMSDGRFAAPKRRVGGEMTAITGTPATLQLFRRGAARLGPALSTGHGLAVAGAGGPDEPGGEGAEDGGELVWRWPSSHSGKERPTPLCQPLMRHPAPSNH